MANVTKLKDIVAGKKILILVDSIDQYNFFMAVTKDKQATQIHFLHTNSYTYFFSSIKKGHLSNTLLLAKKRSISPSAHLSIEEFKLKRKFNRSLNEKSRAEVQRLVSKYDYFFVFSGFQSSYRAIESLVSADQLIFFEIGNFPNKFQWSRQGVNGSSDHHFKVGEIDIDIADQEVLSLKERLLGYVPTHVSKKVRSKVLEAVINKFGSLFFRTCSMQPSFTEYYRLAISAIRSRKVIKTLSSNSDTSLSSPYCLFIGQVEYDTQTVFQSVEVGLSALKKAKKIADEREVKLIVRLHPAEKSFSSLMAMVNFCQVNGIEINNSGALLEVVQPAEFVMTINSTGGLHSILLDKEVIVFGDAFYKGWAPRDVVKYYRYILEDL